MTQMHPNDLFNNIEVLSQARLYFSSYLPCGNHSKQWSRHAILVPIRELLTPLVIWAHGSFSVMINPNYISLLAKL